MLRRLNKSFAMTDSLDYILDGFGEYISRCVTENPNSQKSYISYVKSLDKANGGVTLSWLQDAAQFPAPKEHLAESLNNFFSAHPDINTKTQWSTGLYHLGDYIFGYINSSVNLHSIQKFDSTACQLIAQSALFCTKEVFEKVKKGELGSNDNIGVGNVYGSWYNCKYQRATPQQKRGEIINGVVLDDNTYANTAIKMAILTGLEKFQIHGRDKKIIKGFEACHIWPKTCYDARYHTSVANIILLPREIAGLTDHCKAVEDLLKYEVWRRFGFKPDEEDEPQRPKYYTKKMWRG